MDWYIQHSKMLDYNMNWWNRNSKNGQTQREQKKTTHSPNTHTHIHTTGGDKKLKKLCVCKSVVATALWLFHEIEIDSPKGLC